MGDSDAEFQLRVGENALNKKSVNNTMEQSFSNHQNYPLIDSIKETMNNSAYVIEDDAMSGWQRGGVSAREYARNQDNKQ